MYCIIYHILFIIKNIIKMRIKMKDKEVIRWKFVFAGVTFITNED